MFFDFYCILLPFFLALALSIVDCFVVDVDVGSGVVMLIQMRILLPIVWQFTLLAFLPALFAHTISLSGALSLLHRPHTAVAVVGVLRK